MAKKVVQREAKKVVLTDSEGNYIVPFIDPADKGGGGLEIGDIGIAPLGIDETKGKRRYLNGQLIIQEQYTQFTEKVKSAIALYPSLACTESEWQTTATMTVGGQVGKFVIDDEAGTIRLPKIIMPIQGLTNLANLAEIVSAGLPTHTHTRGTMNITGKVVAASSNTSGTGTGAFTFDTNLDPGLWSGGNYGNNLRTSFDASRSWTGATSTGNYSKSLASTNTVQQEQIQYPYFIQVATGVETVDNIVNEIELNNPYSLLDIKWSDKLLNNVSWLRSQGQANSKAVYNDVYELILKEYNSGTDETETVSGVAITFRRGVSTSIKVTTDKSAYDSILSATGTAWYYVLDTTNEMFYLPQSDGFLQFGGNGEFVEAGLPNITGDFIINRGSVSANITGAFRLTEISSKHGADQTGRGGTISFDASLSNPIYSNSDTVQPNAVKGYLYFYVGETVQNANLINAGRIEEIKANRTEVDGEWVGIPQEERVFITENLTPPTTNKVEFDVSNTIPNDDYCYDIIINGLVRTSSASGAGAVALYVGSTIAPQGLNLAYAQPTSSIGYGMGNGVLPISTDRKLYILPTGNTNGVIQSLWISAYRRLGNGV